MIPTRALKLIVAFILSFSVVNLDSKMPSIGNVAYAQDVSQNETESYLARPDIYAVTPKSHELKASWPDIRKAHFHLVSLFLEMYPQTDLYFLARDSELLFDTAKLITKGTPDEARMHLLNISRLNMNDENIVKYLAQEGITESSLSSGRRAIFIDTGFAGSISKAVTAQFSKAAAKNLKTHLIVSSNVEHPSTRSFLYYINPTQAVGDTSELHTQIVEYEHLPRFTDRSTKFVFKNNKFHPVSPLIRKNTAEDDGSVSKDLALKYMQDLKYFWGLETTPAKVAEVRSYIRNLIKYLQTENRADIIAEMKKKISDPISGAFLEVLLRDIIDAKSNMKSKVKLTLDDLGLDSFETRIKKGSDPLEKLAAKHPNIAKIILDPEAEIHNALVNKEFSKIKEAMQLAGASGSQSFREIEAYLISEIFQESAVGGKRKLQLELIELMTPKQRKLLVGTADFINTNLDSVGYLYEKLVHVGNAEIIDILATDSFDGAKTVLWKSIVEKIILKSSQRGLAYLFDSLFSSESGKKVPELFELAVSRSDQDTLKYAVKTCFSDKSSKVYRKGLMQIIDRGDSATLALVFSWILFRNEFGKDYELYRHALSRAPDGKNNFMRINYPEEIEIKFKIDTLLVIPTRKERIKFINELPVFQQSAKSSSGSGIMCKRVHLQ